MATPAILEIQRAISGSGLPVQTKGPVVHRRNISGSSSLSQHSFGNAMDYYPLSSAERAKSRRGERVPSLEGLYSFLTRNRGSLPVNVVCYYRRGGCTTDHLDHVHVDALPKIRNNKELAEVQKGGVVKGGDVSPQANYPAMSAPQLRQLDCGQYARDGKLIVALKAQFDDDQLDALKARAFECGQNNPLIPDFIEGPLEEFGGSVSSVGDFLGLLSTGELWVRVGYVVGGFVAAGAGVYFIAKEFGAPSVTQAANAASGGVAGAVGKAVSS